MKNGLSFSALTLVLVLSVVPLGSAQSQGGEAERIRAAMDEYLEARNTKNLDAIGAFFAEDYDQANLAVGTVQIRSRQERVDAYRETFQGGGVQNEMRSEEENLRMLTDRVAILDTELSFIDPNGRPTFSNFASFIFVKKEGKWLIGAVRLSPLSRTASE